VAALSVDKPGGGKKNSGGPSRSDRDGLKTRVRTAKFRKVSSTAWLQRQLNDPYVVKARKEGYRSRAAYKLLEINEKHKLLKPGQRIIDLGSAPGGWAQIAARITGSAAGKPGAKVIGIDILDVDPINGVVFEKLDFLEDHAPKRLEELLGGKADGVMSDMAANTTGHKKTDQIRIAAMVEMAADFAVSILMPGGFFLAKVFQGGTEAELMTLLKKSFAQVKHVKPPASRSGSSEYYLLATGFRAGLSIADAED
jgi:23S rRNA (uridine2552-2'-O)-methyltransferase